MDPIRFETHPERYRHWILAIDGSMARLSIKLAHWIAPPAKGIKDKPFEFEYVRRA